MRGAPTTFNPRAAAGAILPFVRARAVDAGQAERAARPFARSGAEIHTITVGSELAGVLSDALTAHMQPPAAP